MKIKINSRKRLVIVMVLACSLFLGLIFRIGYLQLIKGEWLSTKASEQQTREIPIESKRGTIYDTNMKELAVSVTKYTVWCKPVEVKDAQKTSQKLSKMLDEEYDDIYEKVTKKNVALVKVKRWIDDNTADEITKAGLSGIWVAEDNQRYYPYGNFASYVLGHTSADSTGVAGIELRYNNILKGTAGKLIVSTDAAGKEIPQGSEQYYEPTTGNGLVLTIDEVIQHYCEKAAQRGYEENNASKVTIIAMDPKTGDIKAMVKKPDYNPNTPTKPIYPAYQELLDECKKDEEKIKVYSTMWRNTAISDTYEPGSTFKLITSAAGLEEGVVKQSDKFTCSGSVMVEGQKIKCWRSYRPHGLETFKQGVQNSCNPVFVEVGRRLGVSTMYDYIDGFGLSKKTGIDLPGEAGSIMYNEKKVGPVELATISFGQSISVTPIQLITAVSSIVNDGNRMEPRLVKAYTDNKGNITKELEPVKIKQVISKETSTQMREIMESVVTDGGGKIAYLPGYRLGAKTGTAQKVINGSYAPGHYVCSFIGMAPANNPKIVVLAIVDEPMGVMQFGSTTAGPIIKEVMSNTLKYLGVEPQYTEEEKTENIKNKVNVPDIRGLSIEDATKVLEEAKLEANIDNGMDIKEGTIVKDIFPKPGASVNEGSLISIYFDN